MPLAFRGEMPDTSAMSRSETSVSSVFDLDLRDPEVVSGLFRSATEQIYEHPLRRGSSVHLPARGRLLVTGDLHDHAQNFQRILRLASLEKSRDNYLVLHEVVHGPNFVNGADLSVRMLGRLAGLMQAFPGQVLPMMGNHELAQLRGEGISKDAVNVVQAFDAGVDFLYAGDAPVVHEAALEFIEAMLLAVRCENGVMVSHSLPSAKDIEQFDPAVLDRQPTLDDLRPGGSARLMVWGRRHTQKILDELGEAWGAEVFLTGHQPAPTGYEFEGENMLILASDHDRGVALPVELSERTTRDELADFIFPLASLES